MKRMIAIKKTTKRFIKILVKFLFFKIALRRLAVCWLWVMEMQV